MTVYDSIERGAADECKPLTGRRSRTFTLTHLLVACGAVCVCAIAATTVVNTHLVNTHEDSALANFDLGSAVDDDSAHANFDDDYPEGAQLGWWTRPNTCVSKAYQTYQASRSKCYSTRNYWSRTFCLSRAGKQYKQELDGCKKKLPPPPENGKLKGDYEKLKAENEKLKAENEKLKAENEKPKAEIEKLKGENEKLKGENEKLKSDYEKVKGDYERLKGENEKVKGDYEKVKGDYEKVKAEKVKGYYEKLKAENEKPKVKNFQKEARERPRTSDGNPCLAKKYSDAELTEALKNMTCKEVCDNECKLYNAKRYNRVNYVYGLRYSYWVCLRQHYSRNFLLKMYGDKPFDSASRTKPQERGVGPGCLSECPILM